MTLWRVRAPQANAGIEAQSGDYTGALMVTRQADGTGARDSVPWGLVPLDPGKQRITIRLDANIVDWFRARVHDAGGGNYQSLINAALAEWIRAHDLEKTLRRVIREELRRSAS